MCVIYINASSEEVLGSLVSLHLLVLERAREHRTPLHYMRLRSRGFAIIFVCKAIVMYMADKLTRVKVCINRLEICVNDVRQQPDSRAPSVTCFTRHRASRFRARVCPVFTYASH
uniref:Uncharacterized protein n=1 Tax=Trichogramma kaykai TaxID=54128 RepID=A0ABD2XKK6_9HYME